MRPVGSHADAAACAAASHVGAAMRPGALNKSDLSAARPRSSYASDRLLVFRDVACHVDCANIAFSNRSGLNTNPLLDSVGVRPLIDQYVYCLTTTFSFPLPEGDKLAPSTQKEGRFGRPM